MEIQSQEMDAQTYVKLRQGILVIMLFHPQLAYQSVETGRTCPKRYVMMEIRLVLQIVWQIALVMLLDILVQGGLQQPQEHVQIFVGMVLELQLNNVMILIFCQEMDVTNSVL